MHRASPQSTPSSAFKAGVRDIAPILLGIFPFGVIAGVAAVKAGLPTVQAIAASPIIFAGASQLATMDLLGRGSPIIVVVLTALVINTRFAMYSAALAPSFRSLSPGRKSLGAYLLTDQAFAMSALRFSRIEEPAQSRFAYYVGASLPPWIVWQISTVVGVLVGVGVSPTLSLDFAIPLMFMAVLFPSINSRPSATAAIVAGASASALRFLPLNLGLLAAAVIGIGAGLVAERRRA